MIQQDLLGRIASAQERLGLDGGYRKKLLPGGKLVHVHLEFCKCRDKQRGPRGGVCGNCAGAIHMNDDSR
jgi:hypothetical protein